MCTQKRMPLLWMACLCASSLVLWGCQPNFVIRHRSFRNNGPVNIYVDGALFCVVRPQSQCAKSLKPGVHTFFAKSKGKAKGHWASKNKPIVFVVDKETRIDLHDPRTLPPELVGAQIAMRNKKRK